MKITVFGSGYVGLVAAACLAEVGNEVLAVDVDEARIARLARGEVPFFEPDLEPLVRANLRAGRLAFTADAQRAVAHGLVQFIAVGTPSDQDGAADLRHVLDVARTIARHLADYRVVAIKSTVPVGTAERVAATLRAELAARGAEAEFDVVANPEFLREGAAVNDFMRPDRIVIGADAPRAEALLRELYAPFSRNHEKIVAMDPRSAELTKYAANAMLATRISFMNEMAVLAERLGADIEKVRLGIGADPRIGYAYLYPGCGFGGSCFPKDLRALRHRAAEVGVEARLLAAVEAVNEAQKRVLFHKIERHFGGRLAGKTLAIWGLSFKPDTDDMREAPARTLMEALWAAGARVRAYDPAAMEEARRLYGRRSDLELADDPYRAAEGADALALVTEWRIFRSPDFARLKTLLRAPVLFDGRNVYDPAVVRRHGFIYHGVGRP